MQRIHEFRRFAVGAAFVAAAFSAACKDATHPRVPTSLTLSLSSLSFDALGASQQITASVFDQNHEIITNAPVTWTSNAPGIATVTGGTVVSAGNGSAVVQAQVAAIVSTAAVQVTQVAVAPQKVSGDLQSAIAGAAVPQPLIVKIVDRLGHPMSAQLVTFTAQGGGAVGTPSATSAADGTASSTWTLGPSISQTQQATATVGVTGPATGFSATPLAGPPVGISFAGGGQAIVGPGGTLASAATLHDANGNAISTPLTFVSRNPAVATVSATGAITGVARGQAVIVSTSAGPPVVADSLLAIVGTPGAPILMSSLSGFSLKSDTTRTVSIFVNMGTSATGVSSGAVTIAWDPAVLQFVSSAAGAGVAATVNTNNTGAGTVTLAFATAAGVTGNIEILKITFHAATTPGANSALTLTSTEVNASDFTDLTANMLQVLQRFVIR